jgi:hypothetical protein
MSLNLGRISERFTVFDSGWNSTASTRGKRREGVKRESEDKVEKRAKVKLKEGSGRRREGKLINVNRSFTTFSRPKKYGEEGKVD